MNLKDFEGKDVWLWPTGNHSRRYGSSRNKPVKEMCRQAKIVKVARVNVTVLFEDGFEKKLRISGFNKTHLADGDNAGYCVFESEQAVDDHQEMLNLASQLNSKLNYEHNFQALGLEKLRKIKEIVDE